MPLIVRIVVAWSAASCGAAALWVLTGLVMSRTIRLGHALWSHAARTRTTGTGSRTDHDAVPSELGHTHSAAA